MSLTNPNTPVSQQDLQDFYHKILPYIGGSSGGSGHTIEDAEGTDLTQRDTMQFGEGLSAQDDSTNQKTVVDIDPMPAEDMDDVIDELPTGGNIAVTGYVPLATIIQYYGETAPDFFLACDGSTYNKADYPELANHLLSLTNNTPYIVDGDNTKFKVPDLRGEFIRGTGSNSHENQGSGAGVGVHQDATVHKLFGISASQAQAYGFQDPNSDWYQVTNKDKSISKTLKVLSLSGTVSSATSTADNYTSRPTNTSVLFCIAYKDIYSNPMNDYSTDEKVVGTWVNGKPIYQKTILANFPATITDGTSAQQSTSHNIANLDVRIACKASGNTLTSIWYQNNTMYYLDGYFDATYIYLRSNASSMAGKSSYITLQYTKTID